jgi:hypothetical protein
VRGTGLDYVEGDFDYVERKWATESEMRPRSYARRTLGTHAFPNSRQRPSYAREALLIFLSPARMTSPRNSRTGQK